MPKKMPMLNLLQHYLTLETVIFLIKSMQTIQKACGPLYAWNKNSFIQIIYKFSTQFSVSFNSVSWAWNYAEPTKTSMNMYKQHSEHIQAIIANNSNDLLWTLFTSREIGSVGVGWGCGWGERITSHAINFWPSKKYSDHYKKQQQKMQNQNKWINKYINT